MAFGDLSLCENLESKIRYLRFLKNQILNEGDKMWRSFCMCFKMAVAKLLTCSLNTNKINLISRFERLYIIIYSKIMISL